jgi:hypothetical protein
MPDAALCAKASPDARTKPSTIGDALLLPLLKLPVGWETAAPERGNRLSALKTIALLGVDRIALSPQLFARILGGRLGCSNGRDDADCSKRREETGHKT